MKKLLLTAFLCICSFSFARVEHSTKPIIIDCIENHWSKDKLPSPLVEEIESYLNKREQALLVGSFNMLFDTKDEQLDSMYRWEYRKNRILDYFEMWSPDILGTQELQTSQLQFLNHHLSEEYILLGFRGSDDITHENAIQEKNIIFIKKKRIEPLSFQVIPFSAPSTNYFVHTELLDKRSQKKLDFINVHLTYRSYEKRASEAEELSQYLQTLGNKNVILVGDLNTFPTRPDQKYPFYDGNFILNLLSLNLKDAKDAAFLGHFGPLSSTNFNPYTLEKFSRQRSEGVFLDHILISQNINALFHTIDPMESDGLLLSDHLPLLAEIELP